MKLLLSNFRFDVPNLDFLSFDLRWRKGRKERVCMQWQEENGADSLNMMNLLTSLGDHGVGPRVSQNLCDYHGQEILGQIRGWLAAEGRKIVQEEFEKRRQETSERNRQQYLASVKQKILQLLQLGVRQEDLHEMIEECAVEAVQNS